MGEGIIGLVAATGEVLNLADAQNHPAFAYRPGNRGGTLCLHARGAGAGAAGRTLGVLAVQNRAARRYTDDEMEVLETVAMLLTDFLASAEGDTPEQGFAGTLPRQFDAASLSPGLALGQRGAAPRRPRPEAPAGRGPGRWNWRGWKPLWPPCATGWTR